MERATPRPHLGGVIEREWVERGKDHVVILLEFRVQHLHEDVRRGAGLLEPPTRCPKDARAGVSVGRELSLSRLEGLGAHLCRLILEQAGVRRLIEEGPIFGRNLGDLYGCAAAWE